LDRQMNKAVFGEVLKVILTQKELLQQNM